MTNKITKEFLFTELSIKIATLDMKIDKVLELLSNQNQFTIINPTIQGIQGEARIQPIPKEWKNTDAFCGSLGSDDEKFLEEFK